MMTNLLMIRHAESPFVFGESFDDHNFALAGGETTKEAQLRAVPVITKLLNEYAGQTIAVGTHGNIMTIMMNYYDGTYGFDFWNRTSKPVIYKMSFQDDQLIDIVRMWEE